MANQASIDGHERCGPRVAIAAVARRILRIGRDASGVSMLEFGLFFPFLALMLLGTIDLARGLAVKFGLEQATHRTIELAALGNRPLGDYSFLRTEAAAAANVPIGQVTLDQWLECNGTRNASFTGSCAAGQRSARYITITVYKDHIPTFTWIPIMGRLATAANGTIRITADSGVRVQ